MWWRRAAGRRPVWCFLLVGLVTNVKSKYICFGLCWDRGKIISELYKWGRWCPASEIPWVVIFLSRVINSIPNRDFNTFRNARVPNQACICSWVWTSDFQSPTCLFAAFWETWAMGTKSCVNTDMQWNLVTKGKMSIDMVLLKSCALWVTLSGTECLSSAWAMLGTGEKGNYVKQFLISFNIFLFLVN